jgi:subtilisin family serine protease
MVTIKPDARQYINSEFAKRLEEEGASPIPVVIETEPGKAEEIAAELTRTTDTELGDAGIISGTLFAAVIDGEQINEVARLPGVEKIHYDQPLSVTGEGITSRLPPLPTFVQNPVQKHLSRPILEGFSPHDKYLGSGGVSPVEIPGINFAQLPPGDPLQFILSFIDHRRGTDFTNKEFVPTQRSVEWIRDATLTNSSPGVNTQVAVLDTGHTPLEPSNNGRGPRLESYVPGEPPQDFHGHGSWCTNTAVGAPAPSTWGRVQGVAEQAQYGHFKCLNSFPGFGQTSWILKAMNRANEWGADVISMSLGGVQQGPIDEEPFSRFIRRNCKENAGDDAGSIFVIAAGNAGPDKWTIGSPGVAEKAVTVASWSMLDAAPSYFSSRGPQGDWYKRNPGRFERDREKYGDDEFLKPDVAAPGGGRETAEKSSQNDELLHQVSIGWMEGINDGLRDTRGMMKGTSMAGPHVAGLIARLYDGGIVRNASEVKQVVQDNAQVVEYPDAAENANEPVGGKNIAVGFGPMRESLFVA